MDYIYADHAATTPILPEALDAMKPWLCESFGNASSLYKYGTKARKAVENARRKVCALLGAQYDEIFFTSGGTESNVSALRGCADAGLRRFACSEIEHHSVINTVRRLGELGFETSYLKPDPSGVVLPESAAEAARENALVSVMYANNETGAIQPIADIAKAVHAKGGLFHCDCVQAAGHVPLNFGASGIDIASFSAHKFGGPKGCGILYIRRGTPFKPLMTGGAQEWNTRAGTENVAGIVGMVTALETSIESMESEKARLLAEKQCLIENVLKIPYSHLLSTAENTLPGIVCLSFDYTVGENIATVMDQKGAAVSPGSACAAGMHEPSHVLTAMGLDRDTAMSAVRISLGRETKAGDGERIAALLKETVDFLRFLNPEWRERNENGI